MLKRIGAIVISIAVALSMMPSIAFAAKSGANINIYAIYMKRDSGRAVSSDRYGDAVLIESNGKYLLMDTGANAPIKGKTTEHRSTLVRTLKSIGVKNLDVYISHVHGDHTGGLLDVLENFKVNKVYLPDTALAPEYKTPNAEITINELNQDLAALSRSFGAQVVYLSPSFRYHKQKTVSAFKVGAATCKVLGPVGNYKLSQFASQDGIVGTKEGHYLNNYSLTTMITCGKFKYLSTGDAEEQEEGNLVRKYGILLDADAMKVGHHGLRTSNREDFIQKVTPKWSFEQDHGYSDGASDESISRLQDYGYNYSVAGNKANFIIQANNGIVKIYKDRNNNGRKDESPYKGWIAVKDRFQYYSGTGSNVKGFWMVNGKMYYMSHFSGFRVTGTHMIKGTECKFNEYGVLTSPTYPGKTKLKSIKAYKKKGKKRHLIKLTWKKAKNASGYEIYRSTSKTTGFKKIATVSKKKRTYRNWNLKKGKRYYYKVRAYRSFSGTRIFGPYSKVKSIKAK